MKTNKIVKKIICMMKYELLKLVMHACLSRAILKIKKKKDKFLFKKSLHYNQ